MNSFLKKHFPARRGFILILIFFLALFLRTWRLPKLATLSYDEARDSIAEKAILDGHFTLLGPETKIGDKTIYFGPLHYYIMAPALAMSRLDPIGPIILTAILTSSVIFLVFGITKSFASAFFVAVFPLAVIFGRWAWNPNLILFFAAASILFMQKKKYFLAGIFFGATLQFHYSPGLMVIPLLAYIYFKDKRNLSFAVAWLFAGTLLGLVPLVIFELRHQFFLTRAILNIGQADLGTRHLQWHYFLWTIPFLAVAVSKLPRWVAAIVLVISTLFSVFWIFTRHVPPASTISFQKIITDIIASDQKTSDLNFNVASLVASDTRGTEYRYFLNLVGLYPLPVEEYSVADHLYVLSYANPTQTMANNTYEIKIFQPKRLSRAWQYNGVNIYRFEKK